MRSISFIGLILLIISGFLFYLTTDFSINKFTLSHAMGIMAGIGIGLIFGGMVGYVSKGSAIRAEQKRREIDQLRREKAELEKQAAELEKQRQQEIAAIENNKPQQFY